MAFGKTGTGRSLVLETESGQSLSAFAGALLERIWQVIEDEADAAMRENVGNWESLPAAATRALLRVVSHNCSRALSAPAQRRWPSLEIFVGPGKAFSVSLDHDHTHVLLHPTADMARLLKSNGALRSPFRLPAWQAPQTRKIELTPMSQMHWPLRDQQAGETP